MQAEMPSLSFPQLCRKFSLEEIQSATQNFDDELVVGKGGFGKVYKATIAVEKEANLIVAIKRLDLLDSSQGATEFWAEIEMLTKLRHCNLVSLIGYCNDNSEMILIYDFMPNGTLDGHLHKYGTSMSWIQRLKISIGAARGLHYLHTGTGTQYGVIHRDVKSSNILLDENYAAKISDFGLSKIGPTKASGTYVNTHVRGTFGYLDPEYFLTGRLTKKSDVFAFGVVLFELLCGRAALDNNLDDEECSLANWAHESIEKGKVHEIIDFNIKSQISPKSLKVFVRLADRCLSSESRKRPTMAEIVVALELSITLQHKFNSRVKPATGITALARRIKWPFISREGNSDNGGGRSYSIDGICTPIAEGKIVPSPNVKSFSFMELKKATKNFRHDRMLAFGTVYKGWIDESTNLDSKPGSGTVVAVKILEAEGFEGHEDWMTRVMYVGQLHHANLVKLVGYCLNGDKRLLVFEFMPKGSLEHHLFSRGNYFKPLQWSTRLKVAIGAARGLAFLHNAKDQIIYGDFKASNILLDQDFNAKLSDYGLATAIPTGDSSTHATIHVMGKDGYAAPEYIAIGKLTSKSDVYSFGVVLLELLSGRRAVDKRKMGIEQDLVKWAKPYLRDRQNLFRIMDPRLGRQYPQKGAFNVATLASQCLNTKPKSRPQMSKIIANLEKLQAALNDSNELAYSF